MTVYSCQHLLVFFFQRWASKGRLNVETTTVLVGCIKCASSVSARHLALNGRCPYCEMDYESGTVPVWYIRAADWRPGMLHRIGRPNGEKTSVWVRGVLRGGGFAIKFSKRKFSEIRYRADDVKPEPLATPTVEEGATCG
jgi:hypothetical protein